MDGYEMTALLKTSSVLKEKTNSCQRCGPRREHYTITCAIGPLYPMSANEAWSR